MVCLVLLTQAVVPAFHTMWNTEVNDARRTAWPLSNETLDVNRKYNGRLFLEPSHDKPLTAAEKNRFAQTLIDASLAWDNRVDVIVTCGEVEPDNTIHTGN